MMSIPKTKLRIYLIAMQKEPPVIIQENSLGRRRVEEYTPGLSVIIQLN